MACRYLADPTTGELLEDPTEPGSFLVDPTMWGLSCSFDIPPPPPGAPDRALYSPCHGSMWFTTTVSMQSVAMLRIR